jgi:hypothetical protein
VYEAYFRYLLLILIKFNSNALCAGAGCLTYEIFPHINPPPHAPNDALVNYNYLCTLTRHNIIPALTTNAHAIDIISVLPFVTGALNRQTACRIVRERRVNLGLHVNFRNLPVIYAVGMGLIVNPLPLLLRRILR